ncbi:hypothetical protein OG320_01685 [Microbispora sp. NBC_01189]|uniref:hypothetical protein n=1 Tax=Microbispora sp. NBC_01189 TaxID=2903583 RepID=UPI002E124B3F|nr:hypothetical protein OG320_01685 [Microbispora sp. NBC_01189]
MGTVAGAALAASVLSGCAGPQYTYVHDDAGDTYFKVPVAWRQIDQKTIDRQLFGDTGSATAQLAKQAFWTAAFDAHDQPSILHLIRGAVSGEDKPFVFAKVEKLSEDKQNAASLNLLRVSPPMPVPLTEDQQKELETEGLSGFELLDDEVLPIVDGVKGVHTVYNYRVGEGPVQTFDKTAYLSADGATASTLLIRCSPACYRQRAAEIAAIVKSFKVKRIINP